MRNEGVGKGQKVIGYWQGATLLTCFMALAVACGGGASNRPEPSTTATCEAGLGHPSLCDAEQVTESFVRIMRGPEERGSVDMSSARARLTTLDEARREIEASGASGVSQSEGFPTPNQVWLISVRGEFALHGATSVGAPPSSTLRRGTLYGVLALNTGALVLLAFLPE